MISSEVDTKPVFWMAKKSDQGYKLIGTESASDASLFHIIPIGDPTHPSDFHIAYWGKRERQYEMHVNDLHRTDNVAGPPLPHYLSVDCDTISGISDGSVSLETYVNIKQARFSLLCRLQKWFYCMMCTSRPVNLSSWLDGEQFYIKCSYHSILNVNGYLAVKKTSKNIERYKITTVFLAAGKNLSKTGMLFRLHPKTIKKSTDKAKCIPTQTETPNIYADLAQCFPSVILIGTVGILLYFVFKGR